MTASAKAYLVRQRIHARNYLASADCVFNLAPAKFPSTSISSPAPRLESRNPWQRQSTGITHHWMIFLGGGLLPGTLTVVMGATGIGKTQLGSRLCQCRQHEQEGQRGILFDLTSRGDSQNHAEYAQATL